ncbi:MAG: hypothetical protein IJC71_00530 [Clostridia bacterium]|nr:hypothetical protein [Clostridia bacterium]
MEANQLNKNKIWTLLYQANKENEAKVDEIAQSLGIPRRMAQILINRGCQTAEAARAFLNHSEEKMHDPFLLKDIDNAISRIRLALERGERIAIYGDRSGGYRYHGG